MKVRRALVTTPIESVMSGTRCSCRGGGDGVPAEGVAVGEHLRAVRLEGGAVALDGGTRAASHEFPRVTAEQSRSGYTRDGI